MRPTRLPMRAPNSWAVLLASNPTKYNPTLPNNVIISNIKMANDQITSINAL
jgi:hypothetical protein